MWMADGLAVLEVGGAEGDPGRGESQGGRSVAAVEDHCERRQTWLY